MRLKRVFKRVIYVFLGVAFIYLTVCAALARNYLRPSREAPVLPPGLSEISVETRYGPTPAWATQGIERNRPSKVIFLLAHGYGGSRASWETPMQDLYIRGFDSVALSMPGHDASPVAQVSFGVNESHVIVDAYRWLKRRCADRKVVVLGVSMGGSAAWLATREDPDIDGIVTDSAFARFDESMNAFFNRKLRGGRILFAPVIWIARTISGIDPSSVRPVDSAERWKGKPALIIQGSADSLVVPSHGERLSHAAGCPLWIVGGAQHAENFDCDPRGYLNHLVVFARQLERRP